MKLNPNTAFKNRAFKSGNRDRLIIECEYCSATLSIHRNTWLSKTPITCPRCGRDDVWNVKYSFNFEAKIGGDNFG